MAVDGVGEVVGPDSLGEIVEMDDLLAELEDLLVELNGLLEGMVEWLVGRFDRFGSDEEVTEEESEEDDILSELSRVALVEDSFFMLPDGEGVIDFALETTEKREAEAGDVEDSVIETEEKGEVCILESSDVEDSL